MRPYVIITGGGTGIGRALALRWAKQKELSILIIGRTLATLQETQQKAENDIDIVRADIATEEGRQAILNALPHGANIRCLIHNATIVEEGELTDVSLRSWRYQIAVNLEGPLFLTQKLLPLLDGGRILHISSGYAHIPGQGIGPYCVAKAGLHMMYQCLAAELNQKNIYVGSLRPGVVDTPFQEKFRSFSEQIFPSAAKFKAMKAENSLQAPDKIAKFIGWVIFNTDNSKFSEAEWNIADAWHQAEWL